METLEKVLATITLHDIVPILSLLTVVVGGGFALHQWRISIKQKRAETVEKLIKTVRDDMDIATIMDIIDWNEGIYYDGMFRISDTMSREVLKGVSNDDLFKKIDKTLAHFSYICYLKEQHIITSKDMRNFDYEIRRLADNEHVANYLHSLYLWSDSLNVAMSFSFLLDYCIDMGYFSENVKEKSSIKYTNYLLLPCNKTK